MNRRGEKFFDAQQWFRCPLCGEGMNCLQGKSLVCAKGHCFDISSRGYVNLAPNQKALRYDRDLFESRRAILAGGYYDALLDAVRDIVSAQGAARLLDAGCGEGYWSSRLAATIDARIFALDLSKDAIQIAARGGGDILWMVGDVANIPLCDGCTDVVLNIFTPANYSEYKRVLKKGGALVKVLPGPQHLVQLRSAASGQLGRAGYSNRRVLECFAQSFGICDRMRICRTLPITPAQLGHLLRMTPLMWGVDTQRMDTGAIADITIDAEIVVGRR
jgi:23S rRNA (guanine745-N1)-methyltransferase